MDYVLAVFGGITVGNLITIIAAMVLVATACVKGYKFICKIHDNIQGKEEAFKNLQKDNIEFKAELEKIEPLMSDITENLKTTQSQLTSVIDTQDFLVKEVKNLSENQSSLSNQIIKFEKEMNSQNLNRLRDRLLQIYRYYANVEKNPTLAWTEMEKEAYDHLFQDYETLGGDGFMHTVVEPKMNSLEVVDMSDSEKISALMLNRQNETHISL